jgi:hypothetical protein
MLQQIISELRHGQNSIFPGSYPSFNALHDKLHDVCTWQPPLTNQRSKQTLTWKIARKQKHNGTLLTWTSRRLVVLRLNSFYCLRITLTDVTGQAWVDEPQDAYCYGEICCQLTMALVAEPGALKPSPRKSATGQHVPQTFHPLPTPTAFRSFRSILTLTSYLFVGLISCFVFGRSRVQISARRWLCWLRGVRGSPQSLQ